MSDETDTSDEAIISAATLPPEPVSTRPTPREARDQIEAVEAARATLGWSWLAVQTRLNLSQGDLVAFRTSRRLLDPKWVEYMQRAADAVAAIPTPNDTSDDAPQPERIVAITQDRIAATIADTYRNARDNGELTPAQRQGALWALGQAADNLRILPLTTAAVRARDATAATAVA